MHNKKRRKAFRYTPTFFECDLILDNGFVHSMSVLDFSIFGVGLKMPRSNTAIPKGEKGRLTIHSQNRTFCISQIPVTIQYVNSEQQRLGVQIERTKCSRKQLEIIGAIEFHCIENAMVPNDADLDIGISRTEHGNVFLFKETP